MSHITSDLHDDKPGSHLAAQRLQSPAASHARARRFNRTLVAGAIALGVAGLFVFLPFLRSNEPGLPQTNIVLRADGELRSFQTQAATVGEALDEAEIELAAGDNVMQDGAVAPLHSALETGVGPTVALTRGQAVSREQIDLVVQRAVPFTVFVDDQPLEVKSSTPSVGAALRDSGVVLGPGDRVQPAPSSVLTAGMNVHIARANQIEVSLPEGNVLLYTHEETVGQALAEAGLALAEGSRSEPAADTEVAEGLSITVIGVLEDYEIETVHVPAGETEVADSTLPPGERLVVEGTDGILHRQFATVYENGVLVSRELVAEWYDPEPVDTVVYYSTAVPTREPPAVAITAGSENWMDIVCSYDWDCSWALAVIACESGGNPNAYNPAGYVGLFQIWEGFGGNLRDPATNIAAGYSIYLSTGPGAWPACP